jgi:hypothetical protein
LNISLPLLYQFSYFPPDALSVDHLKAQNLHQTNAIEAADEECSIHNLEFGLVGSEEFNATNNSHSHEEDRPYVKIDRKPTNFLAEEVP